MKITIKHDRALLDLSVLTNKHHTDLAKRIYTKAIESGVLKDDTLFAGLNLYEVFSENGHSITAATLFCLGKSNQFIQDAFRKLTIWGIHDDCPNCGCEMDIKDECNIGRYHWQERTCTNFWCEKVVSNEPDWDSVRGGKDY
jgi:hypothetical protein